MSEVLQKAAVNQDRAWKIIENTRIIEIWESIGAEINLVGSLKTGLLADHLDIDFHIYTDSCSISESFKAISLLAENNRINKIEYINLLNEDDMCLEWHALYEDEQNDIWQIDMIHIAKASPYAGVFEEVAERIINALTPESKEIILTIKNTACRLNRKVPGINVCRAVIEGKVKTYSEFLAYESQNKTEGIILWKP